MKNLYLVLVMVTASNLASAVCTTPISRSNFSAYQVLTSTALNSQLNTAYTQLNELPGDCITINSIPGSKITDATITNAKISATAAIAPSKLAAPNYVISAGNSGPFSTTSTSEVDVTNLTATITTTGKPVEIFLVGLGTDASVSYLGVGSSTSTAFGIVKIYRGATGVAYLQIGGSHTGATTFTGYYTPGSIRTIDTPAAGTYTYKISVAVTSAPYSFPVYYCRLIVREL